MSSPASSAAGSFLRVAGRALRVAAWALTALVVVDTFVTGPVRSALLPINTWLGRAVPDALAGTLVIQTPLGGAFRGDFALIAVALLVLDWLACKAACALDR